MLPREDQTESWRSPWQPNGILKISFLTAIGAFNDSLGGKVTGSGPAAASNIESGMLVKVSQAHSRFNEEPSLDVNGWWVLFFASINLHECEEFACELRHVLVKQTLPNVITIRFYVSYPVTACRGAKGIQFFFGILYHGPLFDKYQVYDIEMQFSRWQGLWFK